jgi:alkanesulfonate monooxygenase SsuD/methylene tetrahydromethanopterin reductase-like flavin-dependent oxidoreductase (luciferase family)
MASRSVFAADDRQEALRLADIGCGVNATTSSQAVTLRRGRIGDMITAFDVHVGTPDDVITSLRADSTLERVTDLVFQAHSIDPPHPFHSAVDRADRGKGCARTGLEKGRCGRCRAGGLI